MEIKRIAVLITLTLFAALPSLVLAQNHGEAGVYADYFSYNQASYNDNYVGAGGRVSFNVVSHVALEAEMNYDFARDFTGSYTTSTSGGTTTTFVRTSVRPITGLFGPKFQLGTGAFRAFLDAKVGFIDYSFNDSGVVSGTTFANSVAGIGGPGTHVALYPGGGLEAFLGPVGLRLDVGDEVYLDNGAISDLRVTFGPTIRF